MHKCKDSFRVAYLINVCLNCFLCRFASKLIAGVLDFKAEVDRYLWTTLLYSGRFTHLCPKTCANLIINMNHLMHVSVKQCQKPELNILLLFHINLLLSVPQYVFLSLLFYPLVLSCSLLLYFFHHPVGS